MEMVSSDVYMSVIRKCIRSSSEMHQIELRMKTVSFRLGDLDGDGFVLELHQIELG